MDKKELRVLGLFSIIVGELLGYTGAGFAAGYYAARQWGWPTWLAGVGAVLGMAGAFVQIYRISKKEEERP